MQPDGRASSVSNFKSDENSLPDRGLRLSRPPHPYHRNQFDFSTSQRLKNPTATEGQQDLILENGIVSSVDFKINGPKIWRRSTSPSDSGTEADDESGNFLRVLPAPPIKVRKGLKDAKGSAVSSPLLTPTYLDDDRQRSILGNCSKYQNCSEHSVVADEGSIKIREKLVRRRRAELLRRVCESVLIGTVGLIACGNEPNLVLQVWKKGELK